MPYVEGPNCTHQGATFQTLRERQLRRAVRRLAEYQRQMAAPCGPAETLAAQLPCALSLKWMRVALDCKSEGREKQVKMWFCMKWSQ